MANTPEIAQQETTYFHGEALARDPWAEDYGTWIVLVFTVIFAIFLIGMNLAGQTPGKSFILKSFSDIFQFIGEAIGCIFCVRIANHLRKVSKNLRRALIPKEIGREAPDGLVTARAEVQAAQRAYLAWTLLAIALALYASGQAIWTSYDVRMNSADVPFPGLYDIGFVASYPFFLIGTLLLTRRNQASVGRLRLLLDALAVIGASLALSWFFLLDPLLAGLARAPTSGAAILSIYFPTGDLFLVAVGAFLMFSPLANRAQQPVFLQLCLGLFFLAITDSLLAYYSLTSSFNTGTLQDVLWPLSMSLVGLAAIEYPRSIAHEQEQAALEGRAMSNPPPQDMPNRVSQFLTIAQTILPFILVLLTCAVLFTAVTPRGGIVLIQGEIVAMLLAIIVIARQALTLIENNRLTLQIRSELVLSRRELHIKRADDASLRALEKLALEEDAAALRATHTRVARGDLTARAPVVSGPLQPVALSLNLMLDRLGSISQQSSRYAQLAQELKMVQEAIERLEQGMPPWTSTQPPAQCTSDFRAIFTSLLHVQRTQGSEWRNLRTALESMNSLMRQLRETLAEIRRSKLFADLSQSNFERMILELVIRQTEVLEQQQQKVLNQVAQSMARYEARTTPIPALKPGDPPHP